MAWKLIGLVSMQDQRMLLLYLWMTHSLETVVPVDTLQLHRLFTAVVYTVVAMQESLKAPTSTATRTLQANCQDRRG